MLVVRTVRVAPVWQDKSSRSSVRRCRGRVNLRVSAADGLVPTEAQLRPRPQSAWQTALCHPGPSATPVRPRGAYLCRWGPASAPCVLPRAYLTVCLFVCPGRKSIGLVTDQDRNCPSCQPDLLGHGLGSIWGLKVTLFESGSRTSVPGRVPSLSPHKAAGRPRLLSRASHVC